MSLHTSQKAIAAAIAAVALLFGVGVDVTHCHAKQITLHQFDLEPVTGAVTQAGWTHVDPGTSFTPTTGGFDYTTTYNGTSADTVLLGAFTRPPAMSSPPVPPPYDVRTDEIIGYGQGSSKSTIVFRDYIAPFSDGLSLTIYRDDPADNYPHSQTRTDIRIDGGAPITIDDDSTSELGDSGGFIHAPITYTMSLPEVATVRTLDILFYDLPFAGDSRIRIDGIQVVALPEPAAAAGVFALAIPMMLGRRTMRR